MKYSTDRKIFWQLFGLSLLSIACVLPYVANIQADVLRTINQPLWLIFLLQLSQSALLFAATIWLGLKLARRAGFGWPLLAMPAGPERRRRLLATAWQAAGIGALVALTIYAVDYLFSLQGAAISTHQTYAPAWQKLLAAVYGGISEELLTRLFLVSLFTWLGMKLTRQQQPSRLVVMSAILLAAIIFGLGHLPITASLTAVTPLIVLRAIVLNGIGGLVFGWLFWRRGLEAAIIAHFSADIFLLTLLPLWFK